MRHASGVTLERKLVSEIFSAASEQNVTAVKRTSESKRAARSFDMAAPCQMFARRAMRPSKTDLLMETKFGWRLAGYAKNELLALFKGLAHLEIFECVAVRNLPPRPVVSMPRVDDDSQLIMTRGGGTLPILSDFG